MRHLARLLTVGISVSLVGVGSSPLSAQSAPSIGPVRAFSPAAAPRQAGPPLRLAEKSVIEQPAVLRPASEGARDELDALNAWNRSGKRPTRSGFTRTLAEPITAVFRPGSAANGGAEPRAARSLSASGSLVWGTKVTVMGAYGIRMHLKSVHLPTGTRLWSYGSEGAPTGFGMELISSRGDIWAPAVFAETAFLELEIPAGALKQGGSFEIADVAELVHPELLGAAPQAADSPSCLQDAACITSARFSPIDLAHHAVAQLQFMVGNQAFLCTGTLLNDTKSDFTPYLLTAHHCFSTQDEVSTLEAFWDYVDASCGGAPPNEGSLPRSDGGTLLAVGAVSDFTFVQLLSLPDGRAFMGWDADSGVVSQGTTLYRVSHPAPNGVPLPQSYAETLVDASSSPCIFDEVSPAAADRPEFIYSATSFGDEYPGSSGSASMLADGSVVGQLTGSCPGVNDNCTQAHEVVDGAFSTTYSFIAPWLNVLSTTQPCVPNANTLCMNNGRFEVTATYSNQFGGGAAKAIVVSDATGFFTFDNPASVELVVKVLDACSFSPDFWVFLGGLTNQQATVSARDTKTGQIRTYFNPLGTTFVTVADTSAFATCP